MTDARASSWEFTTDQNRILSSATSNPIVLRKAAVHPSNLNRMQSLQSLRSEKESPPISVLCCVYNGERFIASTLRSIQSQTFKEFEFIIVNDGSSDSTEDIIKPFADSDRRIRIYSRPRGGIAAARNDAVQLAKSEIIAWIDADDLASPERLRLQYDYLQAHQKCVVVGGQWNYIDEKEHFLYHRPAETDSERIVQKLLQGTCELANPATMIRRSAILSAGGYRERNGAEDADLWLRLLSHGDLCNLSEVVLHYRVHAGQLSHVKSFEQRISFVESVNAYRETRNLAPLELPIAKSKCHANELFELAFRCWHYGSFAPARRLFFRSIYAKPTYGRAYVGLILSTLRIRPQTVAKFRSNFLRARTASVPE